MRLAVIGSRDFSRLDLVREFIRTLPPHVVVVSGGARGVDETAVAEAQRVGLVTSVFPADWDGDGPKAGILRNVRMLSSVERAVAYHYLNSRGTRHAITFCRRRGIPIWVCSIDGRGGISWEEPHTS